LSKFSLVYKVKCNDKIYVLRLLLTNNQAQENAAEEIKIMQLFAASKIAPKIYYVSELTYTVVMDYVDSEQFWHANITPDKRKAICEILRAMNITASEPASLGQENKKINDIYANANNCCFQFYPDNSYLDNYRAVVFETFKELKEICDQYPCDGICHGDFQMFNMLYKTEEKNFSIIDWEYYRRGSRLFDLAYLMINIQADETVEREFLAEYLEISVSDIPESDWAKYYIMKQYILTYRIIFFLGLCSSFDFILDLSPDKIKDLPCFKDLTYKIIKDQNLELSSDLGLFQLSVMHLKDFNEVLNDKCYQEMLFMAKEAIKLTSQKSFGM
jgi:thiamine kinase-like enzyme